MREKYTPEFHPGPNGNNHENTCRMIGDWPSSSSALSVLSCLTGVHDCMSVSYYNKGRWLDCVHW